MASLFNERKRYADMQFADFRFTHTVIGEGGWEDVGCSDQLARTLFLKKDNDEPSIRARMTISFFPQSAVVCGASVIDEDGEPCGSRGSELPNNPSQDIFAALESVRMRDDHCIDEDFLNFKRGTPRHEIWSWLEERDSEFSVPDIIVIKPSKTIADQDRISSIYDMYLGGKKLTNNEVIVLQEHFAQVVDCLSVLGQRFALASDEAERVHQELVGHRKLRGI